MPSSANEQNSAVPPWLTKTSGRPDRGITPSIEAIFTNDCDTISIPIPTANSPPKGSGARVAILNTCKAKKQMTRMMVLKTRGQN